HRPRAVLHQQTVDNDEGEAKLGRSELQVTDLQTISSRKRQKRAELIPSEDREHDENLVAGALREDKCITDDYRAQEEIVEQVIHVVAPPDETRTSIFTYFPVVVICHILQGYHGGDSPQPPQILRAQVREKQDEKRPHQRQHRQVISFKPGGNAWQDPRGEPSLEGG